MDERNKFFKVIIIGTGSSGLIFTDHLVRCFIKSGISPVNICAIGKNNGSPSILSSWYIAQFDPKILKEKFLSNLNKNPSEKQTELLKYIAYNHVEETNKFSKDVINGLENDSVDNLLKGFSKIPTLTGISTTNLFPGNRILKFLEKRIKKNHGLILKGTVFDLDNLNDKFKISALLKGKKYTLISDKLMIASGGLAYLNNFATSASNVFPNILELSRDRLNIEVEDLSRAVYFPFAVNQSGFRSGSLLSVSFVSKSKVLVKTKEGHLKRLLPSDIERKIATGDYRSEFPKLTSIFNQEIKNGSKIIVATDMSEAAFNDFKKNDRYGYVFRRKTFKECRFINVAPAYHSTLGGIIIDSKCRTSNKDIFAIGEAASIFGNNRPLGAEHISAITLAPLAANVITRDFLDADFKGKFKTS